MRELILRHPEYTTEKQVRVSIGTWNVNGGKHFRSIAFKHELITDWLLDLPKITEQTRPGSLKVLLKSQKLKTFCKMLGFLCFCPSELIDPGVDFSQPVDVFALGFQEIVDLSASNIMNARCAMTSHMSRGHCCFYTHLLLQYREPARVGCAPARQVESRTQVRAADVSTTCWRLFLHLHSTTTRTLCQVTNCPPHIAHSHPLSYHVRLVCFQGCSCGDD